MTVIYQRSGQYEDGVEEFLDPVFGTPKYTGVDGYTHTNVLERLIPVDSVIAGPGTPGPHHRRLTLDYSGAKLPNSSVGIHANYMNPRRFSSIHVDTTLDPSYIHVDIHL